MRLGRRRARPHPDRPRRRPSPRPFWSVRRTRPSAEPRHAATAAARPPPAPAPALTSPATTPRNTPPRPAPGVLAIDPVRITVGQHHLLGLLALTTEDEPGLEHDLLTHAGFTIQSGDFLYTLPGTPNDPAAIRTAVTGLRASARALGIRIGIDPGLAAALEQDLLTPSAPGAGRGPAAEPGPALTTAVPAQPAAVAAPSPHPIR